MTSAERKRLLKRLMKAAGQRGWKGGTDESKAAKFLTWVEDTSTVFEDTDGDEIDIKALVVEQLDSRTVQVSEVDDEEPTDEMEMEEDEEEEQLARRSAASLATELKEVKNDCKKLRSKYDVLEKFYKQGTTTPAVSVKSAEEAIYEADIKAGRAAFSSYANAKGFARGLQIGAMVQVGRLPDAQEARKGLLEFMEKTGMETKAYATTPISAGGAFIPEQYIPDLIELQDEYGDTRSLCNVIPMTSDKATRPRTTGILDMYYPGEGGTATESTTTQDVVELQAKKGFTLVRMSSEILEDSAIGIAEFVARKIAQSEAFVIDNTWVNGDGSPGTSGDKRIPNSLGYLNLFGTTATSDARSHTGAATADAHDIGDLTALMSKLPRWARKGAVFVCSPEIDAVTFQRLGITEVGGLTHAEFQGQTVSAFRGHPIVHVATMPTAIDSDADQVDIMFGRFDLSNMLGDRRTLEITTSGVDRHFDTDEIAVRGIVRHDFNIHDLGSTTAQSPVVALWQDHT